MLDTSASLTSGADFLLHALLDEIGESLELLFAVLILLPERSWDVMAGDGRRGEESLNIHWNTTVKTMIL